MTEFAEPKCPECGKSRFSYNIVASRNTIARSEYQIEIAQKKLMEEKEKLENATPQRLKNIESHINSQTRQLEKRLERFEELLENRTDTGHGLIFFCLNCGHIIGTGGKSKNARDSSFTTDG